MYRIIWICIQTNISQYKPQRAVPCTLVTYLFFWSTTGSCSSLFVPILQSGMLFYISLGWMLNWISIHSFNIKTWDDSNPHNSSLKDLKDFPTYLTSIELSRALQMQWRKCICPAECNHKMSRLRWWVTCRQVRGKPFHSDKTKGQMEIWTWCHGYVSSWKTYGKNTNLRNSGLWICGAPGDLNVRWIGWVNWWISRIASLRVRTFLCENHDKYNMLISFVLNLTCFFVYNMALLSSVRLCIVKRRFLACVACVRDYGCEEKNASSKVFPLKVLYMMLSDSSETKWIKDVYQYSRTRRWRKFQKGKNIKFGRTCAYRIVCDNLDSLNIFFWWREQSWHLLALSQRATPCDTKF